MASSSATKSSTATLLHFEGSNFLRARLVMATLRGRAIRISKIRERSDNPGLTESEASVLRLVDKLTNGSKIEISQTGTALFYHPGMLIGGRLEHDCCTKRGIGYYLEILFYLGPFCKKPLEVTLRGVTNKKGDPSPELLQYSFMPIMKRYFLVDDGLELRVKRRGAAPGGGGECLFRCPMRKSLRAQQFCDQGKVKRVRGVAWTARVSPAMANRLVESSKGVLLQFLPDVYIHTSHLKSSSAGNSPGFGIVLCAETTTGVTLCAEAQSSAPDDNQRSLSGGVNGREVSVPDDIGVAAANALLEEIFRGGCVDSRAQSLQVLFMTLSQQDVSKVTTGPLSNYTIHFLRHLRDFFGTTFKLEESKDKDQDMEEEALKIGAEKVKLTCLGVGYTNLSKRTT